MVFEVAPFQLLLMQRLCLQFMFDLTFSAVCAAALGCPFEKYVTVSFLVNQLRMFQIPVRNHGRGFDGHRHDCEPAACCLWHKQPSDVVWISLLVPLAFDCCHPYRLRGVLLPVGGCSLGGLLLGTYPLVLDWDTNWQVT